MDWKSTASGDVAHVAPWAYKVYRERWTASNVRPMWRLERKDQSGGVYHLGQFETEEAAKSFADSCDHSKICKPVTPQVPWGGQS